MNIFYESVYILRKQDTTGLIIGKNDIKIASNYMHQQWLPIPEMLQDGLPREICFKFPDNSGVLLCFMRQCVEPIGKILGGFY